MITDPERLEAVFYSAPVPINLATLTLCALIFDRLHFPNVRIPFEGFDPEWVSGEVQRIENAAPRDYDSFLLLQAMRCTLNPALKEFCYSAQFIAQTEVYPALEELRNEISKASEKGWIGRTWKLAKATPELVCEYSLGNWPSAVQKTIKAFGDWWIAGATEDKPRSGLHYLIKERASSARVIVR